MAFPTIPTVADGRVLFTNAAGASGTRTFPDLSSLTKAAGDLLIAIVYGYQSSAVAGSVWSGWGASFTEFCDVGSTLGSIGAAYKVSTGSETGTFTVAQAATVTGGASMVLLAIPGGHNTTPPEATAIATGTGAGINAVSLNPTGWDVEDTLWIAVGGSGETSGTGAWGGMTSAPTNYTNYADAATPDTSTIGECEIAVAFRTSAAASEDAGAFTYDTSNTRNVALTIAIRPAPSTQTSSSVVAFTVALTTVAKLVARAQTTQALTATLTTVARVARKGQTTQALTAALTTTGQRTLRSQATQALTAAITSAGQRTAFGQATQALTVALVTDGTVEAPPSGEDVFGQAVLPLVWDAVTDAHLAQYALPAADSVDGQWTTQAGGADLEQAIDDLVVDDADYIRSELHPDSSACRIKLGPLTDPDMSTGHVLRWRIGKDTAGGNTVNMTLSLYEGGGDVLGAGVLVAQFARNDVAAGFATFEEHLSEAEADTISNYGNLFLELAGDVV